MLSQLGIVHECEKPLEDKLVDIYISPSFFKSTLSGTQDVMLNQNIERIRGVVIEVDGPSHFDSYIRVSVS